MQRTGTALMAVVALALLGLLGNPHACAEGSARSAGTRGSVVFQKYCALCHGPQAKGDGRAARLHQPAPYDLTRSIVSDEYRALIIRRGGKALGRSEAMPPWEAELSDAQIRDVIAYLRMLRTRTTPSR